MDTRSVSPGQRFPDIHTDMVEALGQSEAFLGFQEQLSRVAPVERPVLILGERGTGKELAVRRLHFLSRRWQEPFVTLNCAMLAPSLVESELFGHEKGAFTGAAVRRSGRFEAADRGTLFLDEIGSIPLQAQEKILRVVEYNSFERVGGSAPIEVDVRIIGATNANLGELAARDEFKADLLDRLSFEVLYLPPLRERKGDILILAKHFAARMAYELNRTDVPEFASQAVAALERYPWPGNIRELKNVVERAVYKADDTMVTEILFDPFQSPYPSMSKAKQHQHQGPHSGATVVNPAEIFLEPLKPAVQRLEIQLLRQALQKSQYNQKQAARLLGLTYDQFRNLKRKHNKELG